MLAQGLALPAQGSALAQGLALLAQGSALAQGLALPAQGSALAQGSACTSEPEGAVVFGVGVVHAVIRPTLNTEAIA
jgi:hypothetical protein